MKKAIAVLLAVLLAMPFAFASIERGDRITTFDEGNALVGEGGYADISSWNTEPDVFVCATKQGRIVEYGANLQNWNQYADVRNMIEALVQEMERGNNPFAGFDHYGCLRANI